MNDPDVKIYFTKPNLEKRGFVDPTNITNIRVIDKHVNTTYCKNLEEARAMKNRTIILWDCEDD